MPENARIIDSTWAMKKKANGTYRARLNARGFQQVEGEHYNGSSISAPVVSDITIRVVLVLMIMAGWVGEVLDMKGAFLHGDIDKNQRMYMEVPKGFEKHYDPNYYVLLLLQTLYGLKQAAVSFWKKLLQCFSSMGFERSKAEPCLYFAWTVLGLVLWVSWVDDCFVVGNKEAVVKAKKDMMDRFDCDEVGELTEYVGCKIERNWKERWIKITQPVLLQSYSDEFELPSAVYHTPAETGQVLVPCKEEDAIAAEEQAKYRSGVGKMLHMMRWSRPEILNSVRELSKYMGRASAAHYKAMHRVMKYCVDTANRGFKLQPARTWDGSKSFKFRITGLADSNYATCPVTRRSVSGYGVFLEKAPVGTRSAQQRTVALSSAEAELGSGTQCAQEMLYVWRLMQSMGLEVELPMILEIDNKGAVDIANGWSTNGRTRHIDVRMYFLRELKEAGIIDTRWISGKRMSSDLFTKNLDRVTFETHVKAFCGEDEYMQV